MATTNDWVCSKKPRPMVVTTRKAQDYFPGRMPEPEEITPIAAGHRRQVIIGQVIAAAPNNNPND